MMKFFPWIFVPTFLFAVGCDRQPDSQTYHVEVPSHAVWTASGIVPQAGQTLTLNASGRYVDHAQGHDCGPEGIAAAKPSTGKWPDFNAGRNKFFSARLQSRPSCEFAWERASQSPKCI